MVSGHCLASSVEINPRLISIVIELDLRRCDRSGSRWMVGPKVLHGTKIRPSETWGH